MSRATTVFWFNLVAGLLAAAPPARADADALALPVRPPAERRVAQAGAGSQAHAALNNAIDCQRRNDYDMAHVYLQQARARIQDLTPAEQADLARLMQQNTLALQARRDGNQLLGQAELFIRGGRVNDAANLLKKVSTSFQYLKSEDQQRFYQVRMKLRTQMTSPGAPPAPGAALVRARVQQARAAFNQADFETAQRLAQEAAALGVPLSPGEDTPQQVLADLNRASKDPHTLLRAARIALQRGQLDSAENYVHRAERCSTVASFSLSSDSPRRVLEDVKAARAKKAGPGATAPAAHLPTVAPGARGGNAPGYPPANAARPVQGPTAQVPGASAGAANQAPVVPPDQARLMLRRARQALAAGDLVTARQISQQMRILNVRMPANEDNPLRLEADLAQAEAGRRSIPVAQAASPNMAAQASAYQSPATMTPREDAEGWLKQGRNMLAANRLEEAAHCAARARAITSVRWGLFGDSPSKLLRDVDKARTRRDREASARVLVEARRLFEQQDYDRAQKLACQAMKLHGDYSWYEMSDRPEKLLAEIQTAREQARRMPLPKPVVIPSPPPPPLVQNRPPAGVRPAQVASRRDTPVSPPTGGTGGPPVPGGLPMVGAAPATPPAGSRGAQAPPGTSTVSRQALEAQARQLLGRARVALQKGDTAGARLLAEQVRNMRLTLCQSDRQALESIYRAIEQTAQPARLPALASNASNLPGAPKGVTPPGGSRQQGVNTPRSPGAVASGNPQSAIRNPQSTDAGKLQAQRLLAEARNLQRAGRLVEARAKVLEARRYNVLFRADEDNPNLAYRDLAIQASKQIEGILDRASQEVAYGFGDAASRYQKAEHKLLEARQLANHFGLDPRPVEQKLAWVTQLRRGGPAQMAGIPPVAPPQARPTSPGLLLLEKARLELRKNQLATARQMAVDAYNGHYGVENDALAMIRSIEVEEAKQRCLEVCRAFDAAYNAYTRRHDYEQASIIFRGLNPQMLDPVRRDKLKELLMTPELRLASHSDRGEGRGTRSEGQEARSDSPSSPVSPLAPHPSPLSSDGAGHARASDTNLEASLLERTRALREVNFQRWRKQSLDIQKQSAEKFRAGQTEEALNQLTDLLAQLDAQSDKLEVGQLTLLKRPVEARLNGFRSLASQQELQRGASDAHDRFLRENEQIRTNEENKQKTMSQLMKQFNELYREGKYVEAEAIAMRGKELDPDNGVATAAVHMARMQRNRKEYADIKDGKAEMFRQSANWAETQGPFTADVYVDPDSAARSRGRKPLGPIQVGHLNDREMGIERKLMSTISPLNLKDVPLRDVINDLRAYHHLNIWIDEPALGEASISLDSPISGNLENISLKSALNLILHNAHLTYQVKDEALQITTVEKAAGQLKTVTYAVADLVIPVPNFCDIQHPIAPELQGHSDSAGPAGEMAPTPTPVPLGLPSGTATGTSLGGQGGSNFATAQSGGVVAVRNDGPTQQESLIKLITSSIKPQSWQDMGGKGTIDYHPLTMALIINQTPDIQEQVAELLAALRRLQDQEVAVEVRFITIAEDFFERIGVNFNMNIVNQSGTSRFQPQITSGQFTPAGYINEFAPKDFLAGLTPAGTFTSNLDIPITTNTFTQSIPPFGGYPGVPGFGGITLGLGFLSDIQVFLFLEAVQGDVRTNVMQAPKLTMFNGQTATLFVGDYQYFTTAVTITPNRGQFTYSPNAIARPLGVFLSMQPVISADRRFVRMSINPSLTNLSTPNIELFPVVVPIFPLFDGTATGQPVVFTQFLQQPVITSIFVQTTVVVPDGGTVLMGGLKRLSEGRREYGPPILSKLPFINRLFKNVGYGRDVHSLLLMVTPRIIIQEEEEFRATGYVAPSNVIER